MKRLANLALVAVIVVGFIAGYAISPAATIAAQRGSDPNLVNGHHQPPEFKSVIPAPQLRQPVPMWPNQPQNATYWSIDDIRAAHETISAAHRSGKKIDPNSTLHDFPYWTRTHSLFIYHTPQNEAGRRAHQHAGYSQFIVIMGGTGSVVAGGQLQNPAVLIEDGRPIPGELRGPSISGGETFTLKEGDWISIPPNTPAQFKAEAGGLTYMVMKVNAMLYPWELIR
jgi:mannose-6-phosphate isomerase-like protein (cupin superfamily)